MASFRAAFKNQDDTAVWHSAIKNGLRPIGRTWWLLSGPLVLAPSIADMSERALKGPFRHTAVAAVYQDVDEITLVRYSPPCITAAERKRGSAQPQEKEGNRLKTGDGGNEESLAELLVLADEVQNSMVENFRLLPVGRMSAVLKYDSLCCRYPGRDHPHQRRRQGGVRIRGR